MIIRIVASTKSTISFAGTMNFKKMADGGFRPAYNMQIVSAVEGQMIVAVDVETSGSDRGLARPALERLLEAGLAPEDYLADGGFTKNADIEWAHGNDIRLTCPPTQSKHGTDPFAARDDDGPGIADWRRRMASDHGKALYQRRAQAERPNAWARRMGLSRLIVRGKEKARATLLLFALAHTCCAPSPCAPPQRRPRWHKAQRVVSWLLNCVASAPLCSPPPFATPSLRFCGVARSAFRASPGRRDLAKARVHRKAQRFASSQPRLAGERRNAWRGPIASAIMAIGAAP